MPRLSHTTAASIDVAMLIGQQARRLARAGLHYGHGSDNARDEAAALVWHALQLPVPASRAVYRRRVTAVERQAVRALVLRRIRERIPVVYLTRRCWFAGLALYVDQRVLIPRSPLAELIEQRFSPWIEPRRVRRILDLGTGSGCIAIACALAFKRAHVDAADISADALAVARLNIRSYRLGRRVRAVLADHFGGLGAAAYDIIVSNPPYVGRHELRGLPPEYRHEPRLALAAGRDGLDSVKIILRDAARHLNPGGLLVVEVGNTQSTVHRRFPRLPFTWLEFSHGGGGAFLLTREALARHARDFRAG